MRKKSPLYRSDLLLGNIELTKKQREFLKIITHHKTRIVFLSGAAGTSKTWLSLYAALTIYNNDNNKKIHYIRSVVESADRSLGFLKGSLENKIDPYLTPLKEKLGEMLSAEECVILEKRGAIEGTPMNFLRGSDWKDLIAIVDEAQNCSFKELLTVVTRLNKRSLIILCGDFLQSDIKCSGFHEFCNLFDDEESKENGIHHLHFTLDDIRRDPVVSFILDKIEKRDL